MGLAKLVSEVNQLAAETLNTTTSIPHQQEQES